MDVGTCPHQVFAATLTLSQPGGQIMPTLCTGVHTKFWKPQARLIWHWCLLGGYSAQAIQECIDFLMYYRFFVNYSFDLLYLLSRPELEVSTLFLRHIHWHYKKTLLESCKLCNWILIWTWCDVLRGFYFELTIFRYRCISGCNEWTENFLTGPTESLRIWWGEGVIHGPGTPPLTRFSNNTVF